MVELVCGAFLPLWVNALHGKFGGDKNVLPFEFAGQEPLVKHPADDVLVLVKVGRVNVAVSVFQGGVHGIFQLFFIVALHSRLLKKIKHNLKIGTYLPCSKAYNGNFVSSE